MREVAGESNQCTMVSTWAAGLAEEGGVKRGNPNISRCVAVRRSKGISASSVTTACNTQVSSAASSPNSARISLGGSPRGASVPSHPGTPRPRQLSVAGFLRINTKSSATRRWRALSMARANRDLPVAGAPQIKTPRPCTATKVACTLSSPCKDTASEGGWTVCCTWAVLTRCALRRRGSGGLFVFPYA